jgi:hypothetical protein
MKVFLQNTRTLKYVEAPDAWTTQVSRAMEFEDSGAAIQFCFDHELPQMRVVLHFAEFDYDVHMPVSLPMAQKA